MAPKLNRVLRLDSLPLNQTYFTEEGYLVDRPILTSTGIFEYTNPDGTIRRELRLPEEVFDAESLKSYKGKPIIVTHDAGLITKDNVHENQIGTVLSEGYRNGDDVRAEIIVHDTDEMKQSGLKELSLGYNLDLDETPGVFNGQPYDAIQRNIRINHLALVFEARAGDQARLNIDGRANKTIMRGAKVMSVPTKKTAKGARRADGVMSPEELAKAIEGYKARRAQRMAAQADEEGAKPADTAPAAPASTEPPTTDGDDTTVIGPSGEEKPEDKVEAIKANRDRRDAEGDPEDKEAAMGVIAQQDEDMGVLFDIIDTLLAARDFDGCATKDSAGEPAAEVPPTAEGEGNTDGEDDPIPATNKSEVPSTMNADSIDAIVRQRIQLGIVGKALNMDGLENMNIMEAKKAVIAAVRPGMRLDGKSDAYIEGAYGYAVADVQSRSKKDVSFQKKQMFNGDGRSAAEENGESSVSARQRMIDRQHKKEEK